MRNLIAVIAFVFIASCSASTSTTSPVKNKFNPPSWIIGTWAGDTNSLGNEYSFTFTSANVTSKMATTSYDYKEVYNGVDVTESISSTSYEWSSIVYGSKTAYKFTKVSSTVINSYLTSYGTTTGPTVLTKR